MLLFLTFPPLPPSSPFLQESLTKLPELSLLLSEKSRLSSPFERLDLMDDWSESGSNDKRYVTLT
jgi:hypothetical protein